MKEELFKLYPRIKPRLKRQEKQLDGYIKSLKIKYPEELFVLTCILSFDWNRRIIIQEIEKIKREYGMVRFRVICTAPSSTTDYVISNPYEETGWYIYGDKNPSLEARMDSVWLKLLEYLRS